VTKSLIAPLLIGLLLAMAGCERSNTPQETTGTPDSSPRTDADNTGRNRSDIDDGDKTPMDQLEKKADVTITAEIRRAIMNAEGMSTNAQNCKIITEHGQVTLRGPVDSQTEKDAIGALAAGIPGVVRVDNLLEVKTGD
jgi:hyperosmotically inducible periplasmic protein